MVVQSIRPWESHAPSLSGLARIIRALGRAFLWLYPALTSVVCASFADNPHRGDQVSDSEEAANILYARSHVAPLSCRLAPPSLPPRILFRLCLHLHPASSRPSSRASASRRARSRAWRTCGHPTSTHRSSTRSLSTRRSAPRHCSSAPAAGASSRSRASPPPSPRSRAALYPSLPAVHSPLLVVLFSSPEAIRRRPAALARGGR